MHKVKDNNKDISQQSVIVELFQVSNNTMHLLYMGFLFGVT